MAIYDKVNPAALTAFGLTVAETKAHLNEESLARFMPNENVEAPFVTGLGQKDNGTGIANFRGWDVEPSIGTDSQKAKSFSLDLAPVTQKGLVSERDRMTTATGSLEERTRTLVEDSAANRVISVGNAVELRRAQAIFNGQIVFEADGFIDVVDFHRPAEASVTVDTLWSDNAADPLDDLEELVALRETLIGEKGGPVAALMSSKIYRRIKNSKSLRASLGLPATSRVRVSELELNGLLADMGISEVVIYDHTYGAAGAKQRFTPEDKLVLLPATVGINDAQGSSVARTFWTRSSESMKPSYGLAPEAQFGIVVGAFENEDDAKIWTKADAVVAPAIIHPEYFFVAKVL
jgi:hypothetical protein